MLVVLDRDDIVSWKSVRNLKNLHVLEWDQLNAYDVLVSDDIIFTKRRPRGLQQEEPEGWRGEVTLTYKDPRDIIIAPVVSEKSYSLIDDGKYTFIVDPGPTRPRSSSPSRRSSTSRWTR